MASPEKIVTAYKVVAVNQFGRLTALVIDRTYVPWRWENGGPFFLLESLDEAVNIAREHCKIRTITTRVYTAQCIPIEPQPELFPFPCFAPEYLSQVVEPWREKILNGNVADADEFLQRVGAYWCRPPGLIIAYSFVLMDAIVECHYLGRGCVEVCNLSEEVIAHAG